MIIEPILYYLIHMPILSMFTGKQIGTWPKVFVEIIQKSIKTIKEQGEIF